MKSVTEIHRESIPFQPQDKLSPFPATTPTSEYEWKLYHLAEWAEVIQAAGFSFEKIEIIELDTGSSNYSNHAYLIGQPFGEGYGYAVCVRGEGEDMFDPGPAEIQVTYDDGQLPAGVYEHMEGVMAWVIECGHGEVHSDK